MKRLNCPCCESVLTFLVEKDFVEYLCEACDHTYFTSEREITAHDYEKSTKYADYYSGKPPFLWYHKRALKAVKAIPFSPRVLDFGCYDGFFVKRMLDNGIDAYGCDWNNQALATGGELFGIADRLSRDGEGVYDAITALEVIEHFEDPNVFMSIVTRRLKSDGFLIISCPNKNAVYRPSTDAPPHHFSRFSTKSLATLVARYGYDLCVHNVEYSFAQLLRNFIGDRMRSGSTNIEVDFHKERIENGIAYNLARGLANRIIPAIGILALPIDVMMRIIGRPYIAQLLIARKREVA